jgi:signal transduction histidine kinase
MSSRNNPARVAIVMGSKSDWATMQFTAEIFDILFDRFYRVDPSRQRKDESSSGIGLAIVKSIITAHAGKVAVESDRHSTRFIITLPTALT